MTYEMYDYEKLNLMKDKLGVFYRHPIERNPIIRNDWKILSRRCNATPQPTRWVLFYLNLTILIPLIISIVSSILFLIGSEPVDYELGYGLIAVAVVGDLLLYAISVSAYIGVSTLRNWGLKINNVRLVLLPVYQAVLYLVGIGGEEKVLSAAGWMMFLVANYIYFYKRRYLFD